MAVPKKRHTRSRRNTRRAHHGLSSVDLVSCKQCNEPALPHTVCENCGYYRGRRPVIDVLKKLSKQEQKAKEEELEEQQEEAQQVGPLDPEELSQR